MAENGVAAYRKLAGAQAKSMAKAEIMALNKVSQAAASAESGAESGVKAVEARKCQLAVAVNRLSIEMAAAGVKESENIEALIASVAYRRLKMAASAK
jgi:hypothetical protein